MKFMPDWTPKTYLYVTAIFSILVSLVTWGMDFAKIVDPCIYCQNERTAIGIIGVLMLLPLFRYLKLYLISVFVFYGSFVAAHQVFNHISEFNYDIQFVLATCAILIMFAQVFMLIYFFDKNRTHH